MELREHDQIARERELIREKPRWNRQHLLSYNRPMHYLYVLRSEGSHRWYIGQTSDLRSRLDQHNKGRNTSTKSGIPWELVYYEAYQTKKLALQRELKLKNHGKGFAELKKRIIGLD